MDNHYSNREPKTRQATKSIGGYYNKKDKCKYNSKHIRKYINTIEKIKQPNPI